MSFLFGRRSGRKRIVGDYEVGETLGEGTTSKVKLGRDTKSGRLVALKIMHPDVFRSHQVQQELEILRYFGEPKNRHPNICGLVTVLHDVEYKSKHGKPTSSYDSKRVSIIVTDYLDGGDLFNYVAAGIPFNEETARAVMQQVVRGVSHLHKHGVVHLDIKPENILIGKNGIVKLTDFGLSEIVKPLRNARKRNSIRSAPKRNSGIRAVASLNSLESLSTVDTPSPLAHFFPVHASSSSATPLSAHGMFHHHYSDPSRGGRPYSGSLSPSMDYDYQPDRERDLDEETCGDLVDPVASSDTELFAAISTGRTRDSLATTEGIRTSASFSNLSSLGSDGSSHKMGSKVASYNSISSLDSSQSLNSRYSKESKTSTCRYKTKRLVVNSRSGTLCYQAPEVSLGNYDGCKADVFSLGVVLHVMLYGVLPFNNGDSLFSGSSSSDDDGLPLPEEWCEPRLLKKDIQLCDDAVDLLKHMLKLDPKARFSLKDAMRHVWVDAAQVRGAVQKVAALVKRREHYVVESRKNQAYLRKTRKRGLGIRAESADIFAD